MNPTRGRVDRTAVVSRLRESPLSSHGGGQREGERPLTLGLSSEKSPSLPLWKWLPGKASLFISLLVHSWIGHGFSVALPHSSLRWMNTGWVLGWCMCMYVRARARAQLLSGIWLFCHPMGCSLPGSSVHGILQGGILEWVAISSSRGSSWPRDQTQISCTADRFFYHQSHQGNP